jgi:2-polyprenyl-6-hydroxyphenyl methylase/3-demethylubiquinone-9 3-methyltransferase
MNVDQNEINKFSALASRWWDKDGEFKPLHEINPYRLAFIQRHVPVNGQTILDVGCGGGILSEAMAAEGATVTGIDLAEASLQVAKLHLLESKLKVNYQCIAVETLAEQQPQHYDAITCLEMLEHVPDPASIIQACSKLVKPGGKLFFSTINRNPKAFLQAIVGAEYLLNLLPKGTHEYNKFIRPSELSEWLRAAELSIVDSTGLSYNPLTRRYSLINSLDVNYIICAEKA